ARGRAPGGAPPRAAAAARAHRGPLVVRPRDVVHELAAHQANLTPPRAGPARTLLLALPTPAIVRALLGGAVSARRHEWLATWAARLGGGDGPLPAIDLDGDSDGDGAGRTLHDVLAG